MIILSNLIISQSEEVFRCMNNNEEKESKCSELNISRFCFIMIFISYLASENIYFEDYDFSNNFLDNIDNLDDLIFYSSNNIIEFKFKYYLLYFSK